MEHILLPHGVAGWKDVEQILNNTISICEEIKTLSLGKDLSQNGEETGELVRISSLCSTVFVNLQKACEYIHGELCPRCIFEGR